MPLDATHAGLPPLHLVINGRFLTQPVTGVQRVAIEVTRSIDRLMEQGALPGLTAEVLTPRVPLRTEPGLRRIRLRQSGRFRGHIWEQIALPTLTRGHALLCLGNTAPIISLQSRAQPVHTMVHDLSFRYFPAAYSRAFRVLYSVLMPSVLTRSSTIFTVSNAERRAMTQAYPDLAGDPRLKVAQNGQAATGTVSQPSRDPRLGLYVGSFSHRKNTTRLLDACIELARNDNMRFLFIGASSDALTNVPVSIPPDLRHRFTFQGQVDSPTHIARAYQQAGVFLFPSLYEASPLPPIEAMANGCPVVVSRIDSLVERCGQAAHYCDPNSTASIVRSTRLILNNPANRQALVARGYRQAARFSWDRQAMEIIGAIRGLS